ncbi:uncharacterized protein LOC143237462 [Tachypleus tridentatus]|uniref:uncharacterized protein LOC143237462 n=1 Tax=Tachypleus tridentatus TaxID=6853 RepID=UPI003FD4B808
MDRHIRIPHWYNRKTTDLQRNRQRVRFLSVVSANSPMWLCYNKTPTRCAFVSVFRAILTEINIVPLLINSEDLDEVERNSCSQFGEIYFLLWSQFVEETEALTTDKGVKAQPFFFFFEIHQHW